MAYSVAEALIISKSISRGVRQAKSELIPEAKTGIQNCDTGKLVVVQKNKILTQASEGC